MDARKNHQNGSALLFSLLIVFAILSTAFTVSSVVLNRLRMSIRSNEAMKAFYTGESGLEHAIYEIRKEGMTLFENPFQRKVSLSGSVEGAGTWEIFPENKNEIVIPLLEQQTFQLDLFDPDELQRSYGVESIQFQWSGQGILQVSVLSWNQGNTLLWNVSSETADNVQIAKQYIGKNGSLLITDIAASRPETIRVRSITGDVKNVTIRLFGNDLPSPETILPIPNYTVLRSVGSFGKSSQGVRAAFSRFLPVSGVFDFVLFSGGNIEKMID
jgi:hypothetical protein